MSCKQIPDVSVNSVRDRPDALQTSPEVIVLPRLGIFNDQPLQQKLRVVTTIHEQPTT